MTTQISNQHDRMTSAPIPKLIGTLAIPSIISMLVTAVYNMADSMFVGRLSTQATAAVGVVFAYMTLIQAMGFFFGQGSANYMSRALGAKDLQGASAMAAAGFFSSLFAGITVAVMGLLFMEPLLQMFGATPSLMMDAKGYMFFILLASPFMAASFTMNNQLRLQGNARLGMVGIASGAVLNIALDPLLIFGLKMGTAGASLATFLSQVVGFTILFAMTRRPDCVSIRWQNFRPSKETYREIARGGMPSLGRQGVQSIAAMILNNCAGLFGDAAIAAFAVVNRVTMLGNGIVIGIGQGFQPVCGFNYGAGRNDRVKAAFRFTLMVTTVCASVFAAVVFLWAPQIVSTFRPGDTAVTEIGSKALQFQSLVFPAAGTITMVSMILQNLGRTVPATFLAAARQGLFLVPAILLGTASGLTGLQRAQPIADLLAFILCIPLGLHLFRQLSTSGSSQLTDANMPQMADARS